jgi:hypothetical protein
MFNMASRRLELHTAEQPLARPAAVEPAIEVTGVVLEMVLRRGTVGRPDEATVTLGLPQGSRATFRLDTFPDALAPGDSVSVTVCGKRPRQERRGNGQWASRQPRR